jgi:hypothetical protein
LVPTEEERFACWWVHVRKRVTSGRRRTFDSIVEVVARELWLQRNERIFRGSSRALGELEDCILHRLDLW